MADKPISGATTITNLLGNEKLPVVKSGSVGDYNTTTQDILSISTIAPAQLNDATHGVNIHFQAQTQLGAAGTAGSAFLYGGNSGAGVAGSIKVASGFAETGTPGYLYLASGGTNSAVKGADISVYMAPYSPGGSGDLLVNLDASLFQHAKSWSAGEALNGRTIYTATRKERVTAVIGRVDVVNGGAATLLVAKCASATAPGGGTALTSNSMNLVGSANTNQTLTLSSTASDLMLAAGDSLVLIESGALGTSVGCITVHSTPQ